MRDREREGERKEVRVLNGTIEENTERRENEVRDREERERVEQEE